MRLLACLALLGFAPVAHAAPTVERELFSLKLPSGWHEAKETGPTMTIVGDDNAPRLPTARFLAAAKDCGCIISAMAQVETLSREQYYSMNDQFLTANATTLKSASFTECGGHRGSGTLRLLQHPYGIATATHVFTFIENGVVCSLLTSASAPDPAVAEKILQRRLPEVQALAASLTLKRVTN